MMNKRMEGVRGRQWIYIERASVVMIGVIMFGNAAHKAAAADNDYAIALLRGVENVRKRITSGQVKMLVIIEHPSSPKYGSDEIKLEVVFDGNKMSSTGKRRIMAKTDGSPEEQKRKSDKFVIMEQNRDAFVNQGLGKWIQEEIKMIYNGETWAMNRSSELVARILPKNKGREEIAFDPRILGISTYPVANVTIENCLPYKSAVLVNVSDDDSRKKEQRHVRMKLPGGQVKDYWIGKGFTVEKSESYDESLQRRRVAWAEYDEKRGGSIPWRSTYETFIKEKIKNRVTITCSDIQLNIHTDTSMFDLSALNLPRGKMVIDEEVGKVRYWDGKQLVDEPLGTVERTTKEFDERTTRRRLITISILSTILLGLVVVWRRRIQRKNTLKN